MYELVKPNFPLCCEAFEDYRQDAVTFSKQEMEIIRENIQGSWTMELQFIGTRINGIFRKNKARRNE